MRLRVRVELYVPWGQYRVVVEELDVNYTLGEAARRREEIVRRLTEAGLVGRNSAVAVAAVAAACRAGHQPRLGRLQRRPAHVAGVGLRLPVTAHGARVQGRATEPSVLNALDWFRRRADRFDALLDLPRRRLANRPDRGSTPSRWAEPWPCFPLPVIVGIGHEQDQSVLDAVGRSCKTPTRGRRSSLVETVRESLEASGGDGPGTARPRRRGGSEEERAAAAASGGPSRLVLLRARDLLQTRRHRMAAGSRDRLGGRDAASPAGRGAPAAGGPAAGAGDGPARGSPPGHRARSRGGSRDRSPDAATARDWLRAARRLARNASRSDCSGRERRLRPGRSATVLERGYSILRRPTAAAC